MIINMTGGGGGGLNFKVVGGTTQPDTPAANTIWVNTDAPVNGYAFAAVAPAEPTEGLVWFLVGKSSAVAFNAARGNTLMIYPAGCKQYVSGEWVSKTAKTYLDGAWKDWTRYLYTADDTDTGFVGVGWKAASGGYAKAPLITYNADSVVFTATTDQYGGYGGVAYFPVVVDLTEYAALTADATLAGFIQAGQHPEGLYI